GFDDYPEPPRETAESSVEETGEDGVPPGGGVVHGGVAAEEDQQEPSPGNRGARSTAGGDPGKGEESSRVQDPQAGDAPGVGEEGGKKKQPAPPEGGRGDSPGTEDGEET
ncbi:MAG TPA: hypothetical protein VFI90_15680, partial [Rubrobacter sp.]|nr:hypothetical protein [Rubrobacter sp.]